MNFQFDRILIKKNSSDSTVKNYQRQINTTGNFDPLKKSKKNNGLSENQNELKESKFHKSQTQFLYKNRCDVLKFTLV